MLQQAIDLRDEGAELNALLDKLSPEDWTRNTPFKNWTINDVIEHLHFSDYMAVLSLTDEPAFVRLGQEMADLHDTGENFADLTRRHVGKLEGRGLQARWWEYLRELCELLGNADPEKRLQWAGPTMKVRMFTTARLMETWAHGQEIYDLLGIKRVYTDRIRNVAEIGVRTFGWTFVNRGIEVPGDVPYVKLAAPSGEVWEWNEPSDANRIEGDAAEFCHVVTQGRNIADTQLRVVGDAASRWMSIAQCFAGPPEDPPPPGHRVS